MRVFKPKVQFVRSLIVSALIFVLGVVIGHRYIEPGTVPFLTPPDYSTQLATPNFNLINTDQPQEYQDLDFSQFWDVWQVLHEEYLEPEKINEQEMVYGAIKGMTAAIGDPYTVYLPPEDDKRAAEELAGAFYGVGIELGYIDQTLAVVAPLKGMPAEDQGVQAGDLILHVKDEGKGIDEDTNGWSLSEAVNKIRGEKGTEVTLTLFRPNPDNPSQPFDVNIPRGEIVIPSVELSYIQHDNKEAALIELSRFGERTESEWEAAIQDILQHQPSVDVVLLDMRNNPGGFFDRAIDVTSEFVQRGVVVSQQGKFNKRDFGTTGKARLTQVPMAVLVNRGSASASEIVAGALRDLREAPLIGENTFGKGTVQDRRELDKGGGLHVTIARWLLPEGDWIHEEGIPVDVEVQDDPETEEDEVILKAIEESAGPTAVSFGN